MRSPTSGRRLTVCNFVTVDGRYEDDDHDIVSFFEHQHPAALAQHEAIAVLVPRTAGRRRIVIASG